MIKNTPWLPFLLIKVRANLTSEMSRTYLSYLWWVVEPALFIAVLYLVFGLMLRRGEDVVAAYEEFMCQSAST